MLRAALAKPEPTADGPTLPNPRVLDHLGFSAGTYTASEMLAFRDFAMAWERERCAKVCEEMHRTTGECPEMALYCADAIRKG